MTNQQGDLFGFTPARMPLQPKEERKPNTWSHSRRTLLEKCPRAYYYQYYGRFDEQGDYIALLKQLSNRYLRCGDLLHRAARGFLLSQQEGKPWQLMKMREWAQSIYLKDIAFSRSYQAGTPLSKDIKAPVLLMEYYYGDQNSDEVCAQTGQQLGEALARLVEHDAFEDFRNGAYPTNSRIEKPSPVDVHDVKVSVKPDLAFGTYENRLFRVHIVDWKMGKGTSGQESLQLYAYMLGVAKAYNVEPDIIEAHLAFLGDGTIRSFKASETLLKRTRARILQDVERMRALHAYGKQGRSDMFPPCAQPRVCASCRFRGICPATAS
ncbi:PD-(D/E)XK nuclease family protein [bacterium]|nr:PD-(D/E)XK nuclease family protein [bacterium]